MMPSPLPGGSPGPDAEGTWRGVLLLAILGLAVGAMILWYWHKAVSF